MEHKSLIANLIPFSIAMAQEATMSPGTTTTMRTLISTEITTTISRTPSPLQSPTPADPRPIDNHRRRNAAKPHKTADAPRREVVASSTPQRKGRGGEEEEKKRIKDVLQSLLLSRA